MEHFDPERPRWVLGSSRLRAGRSEMQWRTFGGKGWRAQAESWIEECYAEGVEVHALLGDVKAPLDRHPTGRDVASVRFVALAGGRPEQFLNGAAPNPHAVYLSADGQCQAIWKLDAALSVPDAIARTVDFARMRGVLAAPERFWFMPLPQNTTARSQGGCIARMPWCGQTPRPMNLLPGQMAGRPAVGGPIIDTTPRRGDPNADRSGELLGVLNSFGIRGRISGVQVGPVVTLHSFIPAAGIQASRVIGLADDIALSMSVVSARVAVISGRDAIGIELPNDTREIVYLRELLDGEAYRASPAKLALALGKTIGGDPVITDLARMPHLLIAGTTGSGKSVGVNAMILSLLHRLSPEQCRFIMIDPKLLELTKYDGIPHLLAPVVTEPTDAIDVLRRVISEMMRRYAAMQKCGVSNLAGFNDRNPDEAMPTIVVVIDEMADLMEEGGKEVEAAINRIARLARAAGIHLIAATQSPRAEVITGKIKANMPSRISFQVTSGIESKIILDTLGAERLLGQGDMLLMEGARIRRVHGAFVGDEEVKEVVARLREQPAPVWQSEVFGEAMATEEDEIGEMQSQPIKAGPGARRKVKVIVMNALLVGEKETPELRKIVQDGGYKSNETFDASLRELEEEGLICKRKSGKPGGAMIWSISK